MIFFVMLLNDEDTIKFTKLYNKHHNTLLQYAYTVLQNRQLAEEATHDAFVRILRNLDKLDSNDPDRTWHFCLKVLKNVTYTMANKERNAPIQDMGERGMEAIEDAREPVWSNYQVTELYQQIQSYITNNLSETDRTIMMLRRNNRMSYKEIADIVGMTESNVSVRLTRLRKKIKSALMLEESNI